MTLPVAISTATVTVGSDMNFHGVNASLSVTVKPYLGGNAHNIVWEATGQSLDDFLGTFTAVAGSEVSFIVPHVDQPGFINGVLDEVTMWSYQAIITARIGTETITRTKNFQPLVGQTTIDLDLVSDGSITSPTSAPIPDVISVNGQTGAVTVSGATDAAVLGFLDGPGVSYDYLQATYVHKTTNDFNVKDYGAVGNNSTDDTTAINNAITAATAAGGRVVFPPVAVGYKTTATIDIPYNVDVDMRSPIIGTGLTAGTAVLRVNPTGSNVAERRSYILAANRSTPTSWSNVADIGIILRIVQRSDILIREAIGHTVGVQMLGDASTGVVHNNTRLLYLFNNKYDIELYSINGGWTNENNFFGGQFGVQSAFKTTISRYGVWIHTATSNPPNNNHFWKPSFEKVATGLTGGAEAVPVLIDGGSYNNFHEIRNEGNSNPVIRTTGAATLNVVTEGYSVQTATTIDDQGTTPSTIHKQAARAHLTEITHPVFDEQNLHLRAVAYDGTNTNIPGMLFMESSAGNAARQQTAVNLNASYVELPVSSGRAVGRYVDTTNAKSFVAAVDAIGTTNTGRLVVRCFDAAGAEIDPAVTPGMVKGLANWQLSAFTSYGGTYQTGTNTATLEPIYFRVDTTVKSIFVGVSNGHGSVAFQFVGLKLATDYAGQVRTWTGFPENDASTPLAIQSPQTSALGTYTKGRRVYHGNATVGQPQGWVCTVAGTPGTWVAMPNL